MATPLGQVDYGSDISTFPDLDPSFSPISGTRVVAEAIARRLVTARGSLPDAPNYGTDVRSWLNESFGVTGQEMTRLKNAIERECLQDERVTGADAAVSFAPGAGTLNVLLVLTLASGQTPLRLVLAVTAVTITLLSTG